MSCSACIENPKKFLATSTHHLILQKNLPTVYDDEFLGKTFKLLLLLLLLLLF
jgi:hypothetical protein